MTTDTSPALPQPDLALSTDLTADGDDETPTDGTGLCLSGGGYRAMVFHVGVLWRLNEAGLLPQLDRVSSVSGGSVTAGVLAKNWDRLDFDTNGVGQEFGSQVVDPVRKMAGVNVDITAVLAGLGLPFMSISDRVVKAYRKTLFGKATLQDLPDQPRFVFNATNLESGVLMRFGKAYLGDYRVGRVLNPDLPLAVAVAASSAFPPFLSPCTVDLEHEDWVTDPGNDLTGKDFREQISLSDGGVYDNLGLQSTWNSCHRILVSDAGGLMGADSSPPTDWLRHLLRVLKVIDNQVRSLRKQQVIKAFQAGTRSGVYVGIRSDQADYPWAAQIPAHPNVTRKLADVPTRLDALKPDLQEQLINWGYAICDTGLRAHVDRDLPSGGLPYPDHPLTEDQTS
jgi:NTE family protein